MEYRTKQPVCPHRIERAEEHSPLRIADSLRKRSHPGLPVRYDEDGRKRQAFQAAPVRRNFRANEELNPFEPAIELNRKGSVGHAEDGIGNERMPPSECGQFPVREEI